MTSCSTDDVLCRHIGFYIGLYVCVSMFPDINIFKFIMSVCVCVLQGVDRASVQEAAVGACEGLH